MAEKKKLFKSKYTDEERDECCAWFQARLDRLPTELSPSPWKGTLITDLPRLVRYQLRVLSRREFRTSTYCGQFAQLLELREALLAAHPELKD